METNYDRIDGGKRKYKQFPVSCYAISGKIIKSQILY